MIKKSLWDSIFLITLSNSYNNISTVLNILSKQKLWNEMKSRYPIGIFGHIKWLPLYHYIFILKHYVVKNVKTTDHQKLDLSRPHTLQIAQIASSTDCFISLLWIEFENPNLSFCKFWRQQLPSTFINAKLLMHLLRKMMTISHQLTLWIFIQNFWKPFSSTIYFSNILHPKQFYHQIELILRLYSIIFFT